MEIPKSFTFAGKRKRAVAKATIKQGTGKIFINKRPYENLEFFKRLAIQEPIEIAKRVLKNFDFDILVNSKGGGQESQIEAARLAIARALVGFTQNKDLEKEFLRYDWTLAIADVRRKEPYKPGDSKARSKRQTSFR